MDSANFADRMISAINRKKSFVVVRLDPQFNRLPQHIRKHVFDKLGATTEAIAQAILDLNRIIIDAVAPYAVAVKPQVAFYEQFGQWGVRAFGETIKYAKSRLLLVRSPPSPIPDCRPTPPLSNGQVA